MASSVFFTLGCLAFIDVPHAVRVRIADSIEDKGIFHTCCVKKATAGIGAASAQYQQKALEALGFMKQEGVYDKVDEGKIKNHAEKGLKVPSVALNTTSAITESQAKAFFDDFAGIQAGRDGPFKAPTCDSLGDDWIHEESDDKFRCHGFLSVKEVFETFLESQKLKAELVQMTTQQLSSNSDKFSVVSKQKCCVRPDGMLKLHSDPDLYKDWAYKAAVDMLLTGVYSDNAEHGGATSLKYAQHMKLGVKPRFVPSAGTYPDPGTNRIDGFYSLFYGFRASSCQKGMEAFQYSGQSGGHFEENWVEADGNRDFRCSEAFHHVYSSFEKFKDSKNVQKAQEQAVSQLI